jgi:hypothetical protein
MGRSHGSADCVTLPAAIGEYELVPCHIGPNLRLLSSGLAVTSPAAAQRLEHRDLVLHQGGIG